LPFSVPWWQIAFQGTVSKVIVESSGQVKADIEFRGYPVNGDKFTTLPGQTGGATILPDGQMPVVDGKIAEIVISSSAIMKRQTASQILEAACGSYCVENSIMPCTMTPNQIINEFQNSYSGHKPRDLAATLCTCFEGNISIADKDGNLIEINRKKWVVSSSVYTNSPVRANYGYIRVLQSIFMPSTKMSCTQCKSGNRSLKPSSSGATGGSKSLGEMEMCQLEASGMTACMKELSLRSDLCVVSACCKCRCISILCACSSEIRSKFGQFDALLPSSSVKMMIGTRVCTDVNVELVPYLSPR
jgi:DNA-directed RNA polymerase beta subunit